jgi:hypothetical protein
MEFNGILNYENYFPPCTSNSTLILKKSLFIIIFHFVRARKIKKEVHEVSRKVELPVDHDKNISQNMCKRL